MAITINIYYKGENGNALKFAKEMLEKGIVKQIRSEKGNLKYEYFIPLEDENTILLIDSWTNQKAIDKHHQSPIMQEIIKLRNKYHLKMIVERYKPDNNIPEYDKLFIKN